VVYFAVSSFQGLNAYFTQDDGGNLVKMHQYWEHSLLGMLGSALLVATPAYRPLGGVYYFTLYSLAGFHPLPFRAVCLCLMLANVILAFAVLRRLSGSLVAGLIGAVLMVHHPAVLELLWNSGTIYEILCFLFYFLAVRCYLSWRQAAGRAGGNGLTWPQLAGLLALTGCALDSKEMAVTLPGALLLVELIYFSARARSWRGVIAAAALAVPTVLVKALTSNPLTDDPTYAAHSLHATIDGMRAYQNFLLYGDLFDVRLSRAGLIALWAAMGLAAIALRSRPMKFGLCFLIGSLLPVCLISRRGGYLLYLPLMGWALYLGSLFERLLGSLAGLSPLRWRAAVKFAGVAAAILSVMRLHSVKLRRYSDLEFRAQADLRQFMGRLHEVHPRLARGSSLLLADDPLPAGYTVLLLARLAYGDPALEVDRIKMLPQPPAGDEVLRYDHVLAGGREPRDVRAISDPRPPVEVRLGDGYTVEIPAYAGQVVDLGIRTIADSRSDRAVVPNCALDPWGLAALPAPPDLPPAAIQVEWVRARGGGWAAAASRR